MKLPFSAKLATPGPIGVDPGEGTARLVQLVRTAERVNARAFAEETYEPGDSSAWIAAVSRALDSAPFVGRRVVAALPEDVLHVRTVRIPVSVPNGSIKGAAFAEAATLFPFPLAGEIVQCLPACDMQAEAGNAGEPQREVVVLAALRSRVDGFVELLQSAGVVIESLDATPCALFRAAMWSSPVSEANVVVDVGRRQTDVVIGRGSTINFIKPIDVGGWHLDQTVARKLNAAHAEASQMRRRVSVGAAAGGAGPAPLELKAVDQAVADCMRGPLEQISRTLALYLKYHAITFRGPGPQCIHLTGGEADNDLLRESISAATGLPVATVDSFTTFAARGPGDRLMPGLSNGSEGVEGFDTAGKRGAGELSASQSAGGGSRNAGWELAAGLALKKLQGIGKLSDLPPREACEAARA